MTTAKPCTFDGCGKTRYGRKELCQSHDQQMRRGKALSPLRSLKKAEHCVFEGCNGAVLAKAMCTAHYHQKRRGEELSTTPTEITRGRDGQGRKLCRGCSEWQQESEFSPNAGTGDGLARVCKTCRRGVSVESRYNLGSGVYAAIAAAQNGCCALCKREPEGHRLFVDHDHTCCPGSGSCGKCVRALLCRTCNAGLGMFGDSPELLNMAIEYLKQHGK